MKENNIEAKETIEMSLRLLGGMDVSEQMDTHETEEDREKKGSWVKEKKENDETKRRHGLLEKRHNGSTQKIRMKKWIATQERPTKKWNATPERLTICWRGS